MRTISLRNSLLWLLITLFYCYQYILRVLPNFVMPELTVQFNLGTTDFGTFASIYYIGYVALHIPLAYGFSRYNNKTVLISCILCTALGLTPLLCHTSWYWVIWGRFLTGIGSSAAIVAAFQLFRQHMPQAFTRLLGGMAFCGLLVVIYATQPLIQLLLTLGMQRLVYLLFIAGIVLALLFLLLFPKLTLPPNTHTLWGDLKKVITHQKLILVSILAGLMVGPLEGFGDAWGSAFIQAVYGFSREQASAIISALFSGMCLGCILLPYWADKGQCHYLITLISAIAMLLCFTYFSMGRGNSQLHTIVCFTSGFFCAYQAVIITKITAFVPQRFSGLAGSVANMIVMAFGPLFHNMIGFCMDYLEQNSYSDGVKIYSQQTYLKSLSLIPCAMVLASVGFAILLLQEAHRLKKRHPNAASKEYNVR